MLYPFKIAVNPLPSKFQKGRNKNRAVAANGNSPVPREVLGYLADTMHQALEQWIERHHQQPGGNRDYGEDQEERTQ